MGKYNQLFNGIYKYYTVRSVFVMKEGDEAPSFISPDPFMFRGKAICQLRILQNKKEIIVIATELDINPGLSITNAAEVLAFQIVREFKLDPVKTKFIERYGVESYRSSEKRITTYDEVVFEWENGIPRNPNWTKLNRKELEKSLSL